MSQLSHRAITRDENKRFYEENETISMLVYVRIFTQALIKKAKLKAKHVHLKIVNDQTDFKNLNRVLSIKYFKHD